MTTETGIRPLGSAAARVAKAKRGPHRWTEERQEEAQEAGRKGGKARGAKAKKLKAEK